MTEAIAKVNFFETSFGSHLKEGVKSALFAGRRIYLDPENWQATCLLCLSIFVEFRPLHSKEPLPKVVAGLDAAQLLDFFAFLKLPEKILSLDPKNIRFSSLSCETLSELLSATADIGCIPVFLAEMSIFDSERLASRIGNACPFFAFAFRGTLDRKVKTVLSGAFLFQFLSGLRLAMTSMDEKERAEAKWIMLHGAGEFFFNAAIVAGVGARNLNRWMSIAKALKLMREIMTTPDDTDRL